MSDVQVVPAFLIYRRPHFYVRHRCFIMVCQRVADIIGSLAVLVIFQEGLGAADPNQQDFLHSLQRLFHGDGFVAGVYRYTSPWLA